MKNDVKWEPYPLKMKDEIVEMLSKGIAPKRIAHIYEVSLTFITSIKQSMPLFCWHKEDDDVD